MRWNVLAVLGSGAFACGVALVSDPSVLTLFALAVLVGACVDAFVFAPPWRPPLPAPAPPPGGAPAMPVPPVFAESPPREFPAIRLLPREVHRPAWLVNAHHPLDGELLAAIDDVEASRQDGVSTVQLSYGTVASIRASS